MANINLIDIKINGVVFEDMEGVLDIRTEEVDIAVGHQPPHMIQAHKQHSMELIPDTTKDISLIVFGLLMGIAQSSTSSPQLVTISGVDANKPWLTYTGEYHVTAWKVNSKAYRRVEHVMLEGVDALKMNFDPNKEPKLAPLMSVEDVLIVIESLNRVKSSLVTHKQDKAEDVLKQLRSLLYNNQQ